MQHVNHSQYNKYNTFVDLHPTFNEALIIDTSTETLVPLIDVDNNSDNDSHNLIPNHSNKVHIQEPNTSYITHPIFLQYNNHVDQRQSIYLPDRLTIYRNALILCSLYSYCSKSNRYYSNLPTNITYLNISTYSNAYPFNIKLQIIKLIRTYFISIYYCQFL